MTQVQKIWIIRLTSIPALFFLIINLMGIGMVVSRENRGDSFPTISLLGLLLGLAAAGILSRWTLFARSNRSPKQCFWVLAGIVVFNVVAYGLGYLLSR